MGILNVNEDSFSGDGRLDPDWAVERTLEMVAQGADFIDVGAESARTNRSPISPAEEIRRFREFCKRWPTILEQAQPRDQEQVWPPVLSANTWRSEVVEAVLGMGVDLLNDMGGQPEEANAGLCAKSGVALLVMHSVGEPKVDHSHVEWMDLMNDMERFFDEKLALCEEKGLTPDQVILDPGLGFAKGTRDDLEVMSQLTRLHRFTRPILLPVGRKGFIGDVLEIENAADRDAGTMACVASGMRQGASIFRVHDVKAAFEVVKVLDGVGACVSMTG